MTRHKMKGRKTTNSKKKGLAAPPNQKSKVIPSRTNYGQLNSIHCSKSDVIVVPDGDIVMPVGSVPTTTVNNSASGDRVQGATLESNNRVKPLFTDKKHLGFAFRSNLYRLAKLWIRLLLTVTSTIFLGIVSVAVGLNTLGPPRLLDAVHSHPTVSVVVTGFLVMITLATLFFSKEPVQKDGTLGVSRKKDSNTSRLVIATVTSTTSSTICFTLLAVILIRPPWCPDVVCPAPKVILVTNQQGIHDSNLEVYFTALESTSYVIRENPGHYTLNNLPESIGAVRLDKQTPPPPYKVILGVHSLQQGSFGLYIEQINIIIKHIVVVSYPLNIWTRGDVLEYNSNPYEAFYVGQYEGVKLSAIYTHPPYAHVQLAPGESDELDLQIISRLTVDLQFSVQVIYRVTNKSQLYALTLPKEFEVVFSDTSNWHPYKIRDGHFVRSL